MKKNIKIKNFIIIAFCGTVVGFINGFFGGGGGLICILVLEKILKLDNKQAHATTLCVILPLSIVSSIIYITNNNLNFIEQILISVGSILGGVLGAVFFKKMSSKLVRSIFAIIMLAAGIKMVI